MDGTNGTAAVGSEAAVNVASEKAAVEGDAQLVVIQLHVPQEAPREVMHDLA